MKWLKTTAVVLWAIITLPYGVVVAYNKAMNAIKDASENWRW